MSTEVHPRILLHRPEKVSRLWNFRRSYVQITCGIVAALGLLVLAGAVDIRVRHTKHDANTGVMASATPKTLATTSQVTSIQVVTAKLTVPLTQLQPISRKSIALNILTTIPTYSGVDCNTGSQLNQPTRNAENNAFTAVKVALGPAITEKPLSTLPKFTLCRGWAETHIGVETWHCSDEADWVTWKTKTSYTKKLARS